MCRRLTFVISSISPSTTFTVRNTQNYLRHLCVVYNMQVQEARASEKVDRQTKLSSSTTPYPHPTTSLYGNVLVKLLWHCIASIQIVLGFVRCYKLGMVDVSHSYRFHQQWTFRRRPPVATSHRAPDILSPYTLTSRSCPL